MYKDISLLWEHNAFTEYFNIMDNNTLVLCNTHVTIHFSLKRDASAANGFTDLHTYWRFYSSLNTKSMVFPHSVCAKHDNDVDCYDCVLQNNVNALCSHRRDISLCMIFRNSISLKQLELSLNVTKYPL